MSSPNSHRVELRGVGKVYGARRAPPLLALQDVTLQLEPGSSVSIEGPSGCGKTTLLNLLGLIDTPTAGQVLWDGQDVAQLRERERARRRLRGVGFIFQRFYLLPTLTAVENVELPMRALRVPSAERRERARTLLAQVGLSDRQQSLPHQLSGGEEQRVAIARALANRPGLLLADEPTGELDSASAAGVLDLLLEARARAGATLVIVTHNPAVAGRVRRHVTMRDGRIASDSGA